MFPEGFVQTLKSIICPMTINLNNCVCVLHTLTFLSLSLSHAHSSFSSRKWEAPVYLGLAWPSFPILF